MTLRALKAIEKALIDQMHIKKREIESYEDKLYALYAIHEELKSDIEEIKELEKEKLETTHALEEIEDTLLELKDYDWR